jgi:acetyl-CoA C-acetyltransferase
VRRRRLGRGPLCAPSVVPVKDPNGITLFAKGEHMRPETTMQLPAQLQPS